MRKLAGFFLLLVFPPGLLVSCYFPPYQEELSLAVPVTKKMEGVTDVGPITRGPWDFEGRDIVFYPSKDALRIRTYDFVRGFVVATDERSARLMFVDHGSAETEEYYIGPDNTFPIGNSNDKEFVFRAATFEDTNDNDGYETLGIVAFDNNAQMREYIVFDQSLAVISGNDLNAGFLALGAAFFPDNTMAGQDRFYLLRVDPATRLYTEEEYNADNPTSPSVISTSRASFLLPGLPEDMTNCYYSLLPSTNRAYLSVYDPVRRKYRNFSWDDALQLQILTDMERRIDLLLSNGWLFSKEGNTGYLYDPDGQLLNSFVMGGLKLVYEIFDGSVYRAVFTIPVWAPVQIDGDYWEDRLFFLVYWIPTERLADL